MQASIWNLCTPTSTKNSLITSILPPILPTSPTFPTTYSTLSTSEIIPRLHLLLTTSFRKNHQCETIRKHFCSLLLFQMSAFYETGQEDLIKEFEKLFIFFCVLSFFSFSFWLILGILVNWRFSVCWGFREILAVGVSSILFV